MSTQVSTPATHKLHQPSSSSVTPIILTSLAMVVVGYLGFVRPAQQQLQLLERQCNKLVVAVKSLQTQDESARHGLELITLLEAQNQKLASAEEAVARFTQLREQMVHESGELVHTMAALRQLEAVHDQVDQHNQTLDRAADKLSTMAAVAASITASSQLVQESSTTLVTLAQQQADISHSVDRLSRQLLTVETQLNLRKHQLPQVEVALSEIGQLCARLAAEQASVAEARKQLGTLAQLQQDVIEQAANVPAAEAALDQIWDLQQGLLHATDTLSAAKQLAVDMLLLEPVFDQLATTLQPTIQANTETTRLSRRAAARSPKTRQTAQVEPSPWSNALHVFVALLNVAH